MRSHERHRKGRRDSQASNFFEMLGNFSFGDYYKKEAIGFAFEFLFDVLKLDRDDFWVTVYEEDDETYEIWSRDFGFP